MQIKISGWDLHKSSVYQKLSLGSDIMSDIVEVRIQHLSSYIGYFTHQMINNCHWTLNIMSEVLSKYVGYSGVNMSDVSKGF